MIYQVTLYKGNIKSDTARMIYYTGAMSLNDGSAIDLKVGVPYVKSTGDRLSNEWLWLNPKIAPHQMYNPPR